MSPPSVSSTSSACAEDVVVLDEHDPDRHGDAIRPRAAGGSAAGRRPGRRPRPPGATRRSGRAGRSAAGAPSPVRSVSTLARLRQQPLDDGGGDLVERRPAGDRLALEQAEERSFVDGEAVELHVARRGRHRARWRRRRPRPPSRPRCPPPCGCRRRRPSPRSRPGSSASATTSTGFGGVRGRLLGGEDDVRVVRQHDDLRRGGRLDRGEDVGGRRVHRLAALDDAASPRGCGRGARCRRRRRPRPPRSRADPARARASGSRAARSGGACSRSRSLRAPRGRRRA